jgi:heme/copper-type cytochrome/quinol oxidase subunit 3
VSARGAGLPPQPPRAVLDVSHLPTVVFGHKSVAWWGTLGFMVIEGTTLAVALASYLYLRKNFDSWPPEPTPLPELLIPTLNTLLLLAVIAPMVWVDRAAKRLDRNGVRTGLLIATAMTLVSVVLRYFEFQALNTRWDSHAYGSAAWVTLGLHATLLLVDLFESAVIAAIFFTDKLEKKHFSDASDAAFYQYFLSLSYVLVYLVIFWSPRWM